MKTTTFMIDQNSACKTAYTELSLRKHTDKVEFIVDSASLKSGGKRWHSTLSTFTLTSEQVEQLREFLTGA